MINKKVSRRTFIQGSATAGVVASGGGAILANTEEAWALSTEVLSGDTALSLLIMARHLSYLSIFSHTLPAFPRMIKIILLALSLSISLLLIQPNHSLLT